MKLSDDAMTFLAESGEMVILGNQHAYPVLISPDGTTFYEMYKKGSSTETKPGSIKIGLTFEDPRTGEESRLEMGNDVLQLAGQTYTKVDNSAEVDVVSLPTVRQPIYFFRLPDGKILYVSVDRYHYTYNSFKLFLGTGNKMREIPIRNVSRLRDGGTTYIDTDEGLFYSPTPYDKKARATWNDQPLIKLDPAQYRITEIEEGLTIGH